MFANANARSTTFTPDTSGVYTLLLEATNGFAVGSDTAQFTATPATDSVFITTAHLEWRGVPVGIDIAAASLFGQLSGVGDATATLTKFHNIDFAGG